MGDLRSRNLIIAKGFLFLLLGALAGAILLSRTTGLADMLLLAITIWAFCRFYYFAFYVLEHYTDPGYRYAGLLHAMRHLLSNRTRPPIPDGDRPSPSQPPRETP